MSSSVNGATVGTTLTVGSLAVTGAGLSVTGSFVVGIVFITVGAAIVRSTKQSRAVTSPPVPVHIRARQAREQSATETERTRT